MSQSDSIPIAVRAFPEPPTDSEDRKASARRVRELPESRLVFDTETSTDPAQRLLFGSYRFYHRGKLAQEGLFYGDDLPRSDRETLSRYIADHPGDTGQRLKLLSRAEFAEKFFQAGYKGRCLIVGFNLPFDLSRIACDVVSARGRFTGGFSLGLSTYRDANGAERPHKFRPRIGVKHIDSKRALKGFTGRNSPDAPDLIPDGSKTGKPEDGYKFRGHFLDLRTLAFALTDCGHSLESACKDFGVEHGKQHAAEHGKVTEAYIEYNRADVLATAELADMLIAEYQRHPIALQATKAYSPASIGKAYLEAMGIQPVLERQPEFPRDVLGYATSAFFGGRTSAHIRKVPVPVVYTDFLSMYPTVNSLMGLWRFVTARTIRVDRKCKNEVEALLRGLTASRQFDPTAWSTLTAFVRVIPDGDILPTRARYSPVSNDWQVAANQLYALDDDPKNALWYSLPDVAASVLLTGKVPRIVDAFRLEAVGIVSGLKPVSLRGTIEVDPAKEDFFRVVIEQRKLLASRADLEPSDKKRLDKALKVLANATSYGIYAEMNQQESEHETTVTVHGIDADAFQCRVRHPEVPGRYCFPPLAALITGAARLMLALLERSVTDLGGTYAMEDTDSMAIVATERGGLVACPGGPERTAKGQPAVRALSWKQVDGIVASFSALNPYDQRAVPGSVLKIEGENFANGKQRQVYCLAISAKRYALFAKPKAGMPELLKYSEHGLGHLLNPTDPNSDDSEWIKLVWRGIVNRALGHETTPLAFEQRPAIGRVTVSSPPVLKTFARLNADRGYPGQVKPFNFLLTCHLQPFGTPPGADTDRFQLIAPYETDPARWTKMPWTERYSQRPYRITTANSPDRRTAVVKSYGDVLLEYENHPEAKLADSMGRASAKTTLGLLQRRRVHPATLKYIGKESNQLEQVEAGLITADEDVYTEYTDPARDEWATVILPAIRKMPLKTLVEITGMSRRAVMDWRAGRSRPHASSRAILCLITQKVADRDAEENARERPIGSAYSATVSRGGITAQTARNDQRHQRTAPSQSSDQEMGAHDGCHSHRSIWPAERQ